MTLLSILLLACQGGGTDSGDSGGTTPGTTDTPATDSGTTSGTTTDSGDTTPPTDSGGTTDTQPPGERWEAWTLRNDLEDCFIENPVYPGRSEWGHLGAARLAPVAATFSVESIDYVMATSEADAECADGLAHRVEVWSQADGAPQAEPTLHETIDVPASTAFGQGAYRAYSHDLSSALLLGEGEVLYVAVELAGGPQGVGCLMTCASTTEDGSNWWSNATAAPYSWEELITYDLPGNYEIRATGQQETSGLERTCDDGGDEDGDGLTDCEDPDCAAEAACVICEDFDLGSTTGAAAATGTTVDVQGDHVLGCAFEDAAGDQGWAWTAPGAGTWTFEVNADGAGTLAVAVFDSCGGTELDCAYKTFEEARVEVALDEGQEVLVVVKAATHPWADSYSLHITGPG